ATTANDGVIVRLRRKDGSLLLKRELKSAPWSRQPKYRPHIIAYTGDGSGAVTIEVSPTPLLSGRFGGAIDDIVLRDQEQREIFSETFDDVLHRRAARKQAETQAPIHFGSDAKRWRHSGVNSLHAVEHEKGNWALQLFGGFSDIKSIVSQVETDDEKQLQSRLQMLTSRFEELAVGVNVPVFTVLPSQPEAMRIFVRGDVRTPGERVVPGGLRAIRKLSPDFQLAPDEPESQRRLKLARWITDADNGPFHRVIVNRVWHHHFGRGIVETPSDFGFGGGRPSHPDLLDWLARSFRDDGYSLKRLHRLILSSATYQQSSSPSGNKSPPAARRADQENRRLWRQNPRRMDAETLRDSVLAVAGQLNRQQFGPGYRDVRIDTVGSAHYYVAIDPIGEQFNRRTIYRWQVRGERSALLESFDCPDPSTSTPRRNVTTTASQALSQWNHSFIARMAKQLAARVERDAGESSAERIQLMWRLVHGRPASAVEVEQASTLVDEHGLALLGRVLLNSNEFIWIE
ncbi:MAG: DUF1553 domain-containing protein, partial [Pirellulaceae bacterium]|nr:DUF1553 domain-containing protein [Pirellulaceae bacterium]